MSLSTPWSGCGHCRCHCSRCSPRSRRSRRSGPSGSPRSRVGVACARWAESASRGSRPRPPARPPCSLLPRGPVAVAQPGTGTGGRSGHSPFLRAGIGLPSAPGSGGSSLPAVWSPVRLRYFPFPRCRVPRRCPRSPVFPGAPRCSPAQPPGSGGAALAGPAAGGGPGRSPGPVRVAGMWRDPDPVTPGRLRRGAGRRPAALPHG